MPDTFDKNVFVNCPYDDDYRQILLAIAFTLIHFGFCPRLSLERTDSSESRIDKIVSIIEESKFGIHDISRMEATKAGEKFRMNMPFELGIDYGCKRFKGGHHNEKKILVLDTEKYRYQSAISDLSGSDIEPHKDDPIFAVKAIRNWLVSEELDRGASHNKVWDRYNDFQAYLYDEVVENDGHSDVDAVPIMEVIHHMGRWLDTNN